MQVVHIICNIALVLTALVLVSLLPTRTLTHDMLAISPWTIPNNRYRHRSKLVQCAAIADRGGEIRAYLRRHGRLHLMSVPLADFDRGSTQHFAIVLMLEPTANELDVGADVSRELQVRPEFVVHSYVAGKVAVNAVAQLARKVKEPEGLLAVVGFGGHDPFSLSVMLLNEQCPREEVVTSELKMQVRATKVSSQR